MTEEQVTKVFLQWLIDTGWEILAYDFPQSGTGISFKKDDADSEKNKDSIIPDIICIKNGVCIFCENKNRYYYPDYQKVKELRIDNQYMKAINEFLQGYNVQAIYYGIGFPSSKFKSKAVDNKTMTDFILGVNDETKAVEILYDITGVF